MHSLLEKLVLAVIILVPLGAIGYAVWNDVAPSPAAPSAPAAQIQAAPSATIALDNASSLPTSVAAGGFASFSFTITNTGDVSGDIPYRVSVAWSTGEKDVIDVNTVSLAPGQSKTISEQLKFEVAGESATVTLQLPASSRQTQFTLPRKQG